VSRRDDERLNDILASAQAIRAHLERGGLDDGLVVGPGRGAATMTPTRVRTMMNTTLATAKRP